VNGCHSESLTTCGDGGGACVNCGTGATCLANGACCGGGDQECCGNATCVPGFSCVATSGVCGANTLCLQSVPTYYEKNGVAPSRIAISGSVSSGVNASAVFWAVPNNPGYVEGSPTSLPAVSIEPNTYVVPNAVVMSPDFANLYWIDSANVYGCTDLNAGECTTGVQSLTSLVSSPTGPGHLVIDPGGNNLYWVEGLPPNHNQLIRQCLLGGNGLSCATVTTIANANTDIVALAVDATNVYWADNASGTVGIYNLNTANITTVGSPGSISGLAVDPSHIYFGAVQDLEVAPIGGGAATTLVAGPAGGCIDAIAVDNQAVYWTDACLGTLNKVPLPTSCGSPVQTLWNEDATPGVSEPMGIALDPTNVYWTDPSNGTVMSIAK
jgi:hypothetical protein